MAIKYFGAVELGGTKTFVMVAKNRTEIVDRKIFPTSSPKQTIMDITRFFQEVSTREEISLAGIGVGSFGPLDLDTTSSTFGYITSTPKYAWPFTDLKGEIEKFTQTRVFIDTDVNASAYGEYNSLVDKNIESFAYITIGTGIGGGFIMNGKILHGLLHSEFGHIRIPHDIRKDPFPGSCPYHQNCFEGLASGPALEKRWHADPKTLPSDHIAWELEAEYIGYALANLIFTISPQKIIIGGGVIHQKHLFPKIHLNVKRIINKYIKSTLLEDQIHALITPPLLGDDSGIIGALELAIDNIG
jgi:fructokinase